MHISTIISTYNRPYDFDDVQPFIFESEDGEPIPLGEVSDNFVLACPFEKFSIEMDTGLLAGTSTPPQNRGILGMFCKELSPGEYEIISLISYVDKSKSSGMAYGLAKLTREVDDGSYLSCVSIINFMLNILHISDSGHCREVGQVKYRNMDRIKKIFKPSRTIYVGNKKRNTTFTTSGRPVHWYSAFNVRAHWRRLKNPDSHGLDRRGERVMKGYTWVDSYAKGDGPLVSKVRKVTT